MVPGITDTECRIEQLRYRELHAEAAQQRLATTACVQKDRGAVMEAMQRHIGALIERTGRILTNVPTQETTEHAAAPSPLAVSK